MRSKILIAYFSHSGNTRAIAEKIRENTGADLFEITAVDPYPQNYDAVVDVARREQNANSRPKLTEKVEAMDAYDVVCIGYPNWWGTMPMAVFSFLEQSDFSGQRILPFCTHEGSGMGRSESDLRKLFPRATVANGLAIRGSSAPAAQAEVVNWLQKNGLLPVK